MINGAEELSVFRCFHHYLSGWFPLLFIVFTEFRVGRQTNRDFFSLLPSRLDLVVFGIYSFAISQHNNFRRQFFHTVTIWNGARHLWLLAYNKLFRFIFRSIMQGKWSGSMQTHHLKIYLMLQYMHVRVENEKKQMPHFFDSFVFNICCWHFNRMAKCLSHFETWTNLYLFDEWHTSRTL